MKAKLIIKRIIAVILFIALIICVAGLVFFSIYKPSLTADFSKLTGNVTNGASGYLYGIAEPGVPSNNMTESVDISTVSQKVTNGLQHPIGDISHVSNQLNNTDYNVVYLQDIYSTWYYENENILKARKSGTYDWKEFVNNDYLPKVKNSVNSLSKTTYSSKTVYCLYNECDNGVWFGTTKKDISNKEYGVKGVYDSEGQQNFFDAWKLTYDAVKSINPNALIGGPGFYEYDHKKINDFLSFCSKNNCVPDVMIYHELADNSVYLWQDNVKDYKKIEKSYGIKELPIIVTEYGRMQDNGLPGKMLQYITQIESSKVYGDNAYWRLADNLCDVSADDNSPNSNWWLYRWYTDMEGKTASISYSDIMHSNFAKSLSPNIPLRSKGFMGIASINNDADKIDIICGGTNEEANVVLKGLDKSKLNNTDVEVKVEESVYKGLSGIVNKPVDVKEFKATISNGKLKIKLTDLDESSAYHITVKKWDNNSKEYNNSSLPERYEAEDGKLLGSSYTYDSAYATTGKTKGIVGGIEKDGDGVSIKVKVKNDGDYNVDFIYGKANDSSKSSDRHNGVCEVKIDGKSEDLNLPNTIKSEYTNCVTKKVYLTKGEHTFELLHKKETFVLDSLIVSPNIDGNSIAVLEDSDRTNSSVTSYLCVAPNDGYYSLDTNSEINFAKINDVKADISKNKYVYLCHGLNYVDLIGKTNYLLVKEVDNNKNESKKYSASSAILSSGAKLNKDVNGISYINSISSNGGKAKFDVNVKNSGIYFLTINYSNNDEGGAHDYNVDLIERYVTISANKTTKDVYCRNTYSWETYKTVTLSVELKKGKNALILTNSGNNKFNNNETIIPNIESITISPVSADLS